MNVKVEQLRVSKLRDYLIEVVKKIENNSKINVDALPKDTNSYSLDKIPTSSIVKIWINGWEIHRDVFSFRSRRNYSFSEINNLLNIGFFEKFEQIIYKNNKNNILPDIQGIEEIKCLNCGTLNSAETGTAQFDIQIQITYLIN